MPDPIEIEYTEQPEWETIGGGISDYNTEKAGQDHGKNLCFVLKTPGGEVLGGIIGATYWNWLYINLMWIHEDYRRQGYGAKLLELAEAEAKKRGAAYAHLDTFSFQAPDFYRKYGYEVYGTLQNFPPGHTRYYMKKTL